MILRTDTDIRTTSLVLIINGIPVSVHSRCERCREGRGASPAIDLANCRGHEILSCPTTAPLILLFPRRRSTQPRP